MKAGMAIVGVGVLTFAVGLCAGIYVGPRVPGCTERAIPLFVERAVSEIVRTTGISRGDISIGDGSHPLLALKSTIVPWWLRSPSVQVRVDEWLFGRESVGEERRVHRWGDCNGRTVLTTSVYQVGSGASGRTITIALWVEYVGSG
jgi:hypothetical protein